jgi:hypothetical protein
VGESISGYPPEGIDVASKRVGVDLTALTPKHSPRDILQKTSLILLTALLIAAPAFWTTVYASDAVSFLLVSFLSLALIDLIGWTIARITLHDYHAKWEAAAKGIAGGNAPASCQSVRDTLYYFRVLLKWRRHMKHTAFWTELTFLSSIAYALQATAGTVGLIDPWSNMFGPLAPYVLGYYLIAYAARAALLSQLLSITENLDPTIQLCWALADVHKKYSDCATSK